MTFEWRLFKFIDMKWGVPDEFLVRENATELYLNEIKKCHESSIGPAFVVDFKMQVFCCLKILFIFFKKALLGNLYGTRTFKQLISPEEFSLLKKEVKKVSNKETAHLLDHCYEFDNNLQMFKLNVSKVHFFFNRSRSRTKNFY